MKYLQLTWLWIRNAFNLKDPIFFHLDYADYIIEGKSYLVFSWQIKNAYRLKVKSARFNSILKSGSAYTAIADDSDKIEIIISNSWKAKKYLIKLQQIVIDETIEFPVAMLTSFDAKLTIPYMKAKLSKLKMNSFKANIVDNKQIARIINISYPN